MSFLLHRFGKAIELAAEPAGLTIRATAGGLNLSRRENWPPDALAELGGWRTALEVEQLLESGLAEERSGTIVIPYTNFLEIQQDLRVSLLSAWAKPSPFLLEIDRKSDVGRPDFQYKYKFVLGGRAVALERCGYYVRRTGNAEIFLLDDQMHSLVEAMQNFNALPAAQKTVQESWLTFAKVKGCAADVGAVLDSALQKNDVLVPSQIGLDIREDADGGLSFLPRCPELATEEFQQVFERNASAEKFYSLERPGSGRIRVVLTDEQHEVLRRMKRVRRVKGETKTRILEDPLSVFEGVMDHVDYSERVVGIGAFKFVPVPRSSPGDTGMAGLWQGSIEQAPDNKPGKGEEVAASEAEAATATLGEQAGWDMGSGGLSGDIGQTETAEHASQPGGSVGKKYLLIETNDESVNEQVRAEAERARSTMPLADFKRPAAFRQDFNLHPHQQRGVQWLQTCIDSPGRRGVLLADDMGVGKTIQILSFLAWCIETGKLPEVAKPVPPFRPILIIVPLILLESRTWEKEMQRFFVHEGSLFEPVRSVHGSDIAKFRRDDAEGRELDVGKPLLDVSRLQRNRVVITTYETIRNYQHSFAHLINGKPIWSLIISDEAQEYKVPNSKISHAMKALNADFQIACTGTPVENQLLDLWNLFDSIQPGLLASLREFSKEFESNTSDERLSNLKARLLMQRPNAFLLRRTKSEVADLPPKTIVKLACEMSETEVSLHQALLKDLESDERSSKFLSSLHRFARLSQHPSLVGDSKEESSIVELIAGSSKLRAVIQKLHYIRSRREKAIIFARDIEMQRLLAKVLEAEFQLPVRIINGETKVRAQGAHGHGAKTRNGILEEFRRKAGFNMLILSPFVAGIGLTIIEANHVFHYGRWWNPAVEAQATDRAYRIGQTKEVFVYIPILHDASGRVQSTFDERLDALMEKKYSLAEDFLRPQPVESQIGDELLGELRANSRPATTC